MLSHRTVGGGSPPLVMLTRVLQPSVCSSSWVVVGVAGGRLVPVCRNMYTATVETNRTIRNTEPATSDFLIWNRWIRSAAYTYKQMQADFPSGDPLFSSFIPCARS